MSRIRNTAFSCLTLISGENSIVCQVSRDGAAERRPSGHSDGLSGGAGTTRPPAPAHRHRTLQTKIINQNIRLHHVREREAESVFVNVYGAQESIPPAWLERKTGLSYRPARLAIDSWAIKKVYNTGSVHTQAYFFVMPHSLSFVFYRAFFLFLFLVEQKDIISLLRELDITQCECV
jgi:hypothetical protein